jgi:hypothetical protein
VTAEHHASPTGPAQLGMSHLTIAFTGIDNYLLESKGVNQETNCRWSVAEIRQDGTVVLESSDQIGAA